MMRGQRYETRVEPTQMSSETWAVGLKRLAYHLGGRDKHQKIFIVDFQWHKDDRCEYACILLCSQPAVYTFSSSGPNILCHASDLLSARGVTVPGYFLHVVARCMVSDTLF